MQTLIAATAWVGYWIGIGIELGVIVICGVLLVLMLTGVLFEWIANLSEKAAENKEKREKEKAKREEEKRRKEEEKEEAKARAEAEAAAAAAAEVYEDEEETAEEEPKPAPKAEAKAEAKSEAKPEAKSEAKTEAKPAPVEEEAEPEEDKKGKKKRGKKSDEDEEADDESKTEVVYVQGDGVVFTETKTITELYEELSTEQKGYFDELREEALRKPDAELSISRNFIAVKIGKRNLIKLLIKRGVTVAEFLLENEQLKQLRLSDKNKRGKSSIKVKPTTVQVLDLPSLKVAVDMINLAYEELMLSD